MRLMLSTVEVMSRTLYIILSAGQSWLVAAAMKQPAWFNAFSIVSWLRSTVNPVQFIYKFIKQKPFGNTLCNMLVIRKENKILIIYYSLSTFTATISLTLNGHRPPAPIRRNKSTKYTANYCVVMWLWNLWQNLRFP